jgi:hypothetical protein
MSFLIAVSSILGQRWPPWFTLMKYQLRKEASGPLHHIMKTTNTTIRSLLWSLEAFTATLPFTTNSLTNSLIIFVPARIFKHFPAFMMDPEALSLDSLNIKAAADKEKTRLLLLKMLDETGLLNQSIHSLSSKRRLAAELDRIVSRMPEPIRQAFMSNPTYCIDSLTKLALFYKHSDIYKSQYYEKTASRLLRNEEFYIVDIDGNIKGPFQLSDLLRDGKGLYSDGTIEERLLDFDKFVKRLHKCNFDPFRHKVSLLYAEISSDGIFEGMETNPVADYASWISAMIEEQNALQDVPGPFKFHITNTTDCPCDLEYECEGTSDVDFMVCD